MNLITALILIAVAAIAGYGLGMLDARVTASLHKKDLESHQPVPSSEKVAPVEINRLEDHSVLRVVIDLASQLRLELDGARLNSPDEISVEQRQRLVGLIVQLKPWMEGKPAQTSLPTPPEEVPARIPEPQPLKVSEPVILIQQPPAVSVPVKIDPMRGLRSLLQNDVKTPGQVKGLSIVAMIDEVLQAKLLGTPLLEKQIHMEEGNLGEVIVVVGKNRYNGVDEVPEPEIRVIIKSSISDWEKK